MGEVAVVGLDLAKSVFQVHALDVEGRVVARRSLRRRDMSTFFARLPSCLVGMEACASAHYWARELMALGHTVRLMPAHYVKPYVMRGKTDAADAEAIAEAVTRPSMRFVPVKTVDQQGVLMLHRTRDLLVRQRTMLINALRAHLGEIGMVASKGPAGVAVLTERVDALAMDGTWLPAMMAALKSLIDQLHALSAEIDRLETHLKAQHRDCERNRLVASIPGIGLITASALVATVPDVGVFRSGRQFAAWLGLTPRANSSDGRERRAGITKQGDCYLRRLLVGGATAVI